MYVVQKRTIIQLGLLAVVHGTEQYYRMYYESVGYETIILEGISLDELFHMM